MPSSSPTPARQAGDSSQPGASPDWQTATRPRPGLDRLGFTQSIGGLALALIALFSSYDHITAFGIRLQLQQQWGIVFIAASLATVLV